MSVIVFIIASVISYLLYASFKRDLNQSGKLSRTSSMDSHDDLSNCTIPGCKCKEETGFFRKLMSVLNNSYRDSHALVHEKPSLFQFHAFEDRFKSLEDVTEAMRHLGLKQCRLILGIDFTASNEWQGRSTYKGHSLHHISSRPHVFNPYQHVINILGRTLPDLMVPPKLEQTIVEGRSFIKRNAQPQCIHAFGFGDSVTKDKTTFSLHPAYLPCTSFEELQKHYKDSASKVILDGPTSYAPVINKAIEIVEEENKNFHILIIIADGQFVDEAPTAEAIIKASHYPLSIVVIGVGDGPWNMLKKFDDWLPQRKFDNFQFVEYNKVIKVFGGKHADTALALHTLMEIPDQYKVVQELGYLERPPEKVASSSYVGSH